MNVREFYGELTKYFPEELREAWDNDGIMCCADSSVEIENVLITLDVTEEIVDYAIERGFNLIISHHPLIFKPLGAITEDNNISRKVIKLINNNIAVFSFHTRADKADGGVNDILAGLLGLTNVEPFGEGDLGRIGDLAEECELDVFSDLIKTKLSADGIRVADGYDTVKRVAVVGGDGKGYVNAAIAHGADTYVSGRIGYNVMEEAPERAINLIEAGHYYTEFPITSYFAELVGKIDDSVYIEIADSNMIKIF
jgi:dinuclear metal center YbgI/SA1388 family protein